MLIKCKVKHKITWQSSFGKKIFTAKRLYIKELFILYIECTMSEYVTVEDMMLIHVL